MIGAAPVWTAHTAMNSSVMIVKFFIKYIIVLLPKQVDCDNPGLLAPSEKRILSREVDPKVGQERVNLAKLLGNLQAD
jgi:hypothetical protein